MNQKGFANTLITIIIVGALLIGGGFYIYRNSNKVNSPSRKNNLPDLIIDSVSYKVAPSSRDSFGMPVLALGKSLEFTVKVKNIGDAPLADAFYISNSRSNFDFTSEYYSHTQVVNQQKRKLSTNDTLEIKVLDSVDSEVSKIRFLIATDGKTGQKDVPLPKIEERSYQNNIYELQIKSNNQATTQRSEEPFVFLGKRPSGSNADLYKGYVIVEGEYYEYYPETLGGGALFFKVDSQYKTKLPKKYGEHSERFAFDNDSAAKQMLKVNESVFNNKSICKLFGRARIAIEDYTVELLESAVWDHTKLIQVISSTSQTTETCSERQ